MITYLDLLEVGLIWSVLLMRTKQTLNKKEFVQELTEVVKKCVYACFQLPCFTEFRLNHPTPTHTLHLSLWFMQSFLQTTVFFIYTSISIPCFAFIYVVLIMRIIYFLSFYSCFCNCHCMLLCKCAFVGQQVYENRQNCTLLQFELKFYKDQKCHPVL